MRTTIFLLTLAVTAFVGYGVYKFATGVSEEANSRATQIEDFRKSLKE